MISIIQCPAPLNLQATSVQLQSTNIRCHSPSPSTLITLTDNLEVT